MVFNRHNIHVGARSRDGRDIRAFNGKSRGKSSRSKARAFEKEYTRSNDNSVIFTIEEGREREKETRLERNFYQYSRDSIWNNCVGNGYLRFLPPPSPSKIIVSSKPRNNYAISRRFSLLLPVQTRSVNTRRPCTLRRSLIEISTDKRYEFSFH